MMVVTMEIVKCISIMMIIGDLYVHADLHGASSIVIKNPTSMLWDHVIKSH